MEETKSKKGLIWLIVILIILVLVLIGFIIYDKILLKDKIPVNNEETATTTKESSVEKEEYIIKETKTSKYGIDVILSQNISNDSCSLLIVWIIAFMKSRKFPYFLNYQKLIDTG